MAKTKFGTIALLLLLSTVLLAGENSSAAAANSPPKPHMLYFYNTSCRICAATNKAVTAAERKYAGKIGNSRLDLTDSRQSVIYLNYLYILLDELGAAETIAPTLVLFLGHVEKTADGERFVPKRALLESDIQKGIDEEIDAFLSGKPCVLSDSGKGSLLPVLSALWPISAACAAELESPPPAQRQPSGRAKARAQENIRFGAISAAALADSVNPCAFATIIILVAMMSSAKRSKREIIAVCLAFTAAVYLTYFAIGLFLYKVIAEMNARGGWYMVIADLVNYGAFFLCVIFAFLTFRDFWLLRQGRSAEEMVLQLPKAFKKRINVAMAKGVRAEWLVAGVFVAGVSVSFLEAACTGQVYLPTILILADAGFWHSFWLLAWYNLLFVAPLLIIFALVLFGLTSQQLADFFKRNVAWTKLALGIVFVIMAWVVWNEMYWPPGYRG